MEDKRATDRVKIITFKLSTKCSISMQNKNQPFKVSLTIAKQLPSLNYR